MNGHVARVWTPTVILALGCVLVVGIDSQKAMSLRQPIESAVPERIEGFVAEEVPISEAERTSAGMTDYLLRLYSPAGEGAANEDGIVEMADGENAPTADVEDGLPPMFSLYVGYYDRQTRGQSIHSPKNCLPGGGWEPLRSRRETIASEYGDIPVNRYLLQHSETQERMLVLYWYQGRGRVVASEYAVKWHLLKDKALQGRSDEALVRVMVPIEHNVEDAYELAVRVAREVAPAVGAALPA
ncbi:MAG: exosortase C-terminal domain/associated protein EpsI [Gemmatimonadota bacterium]